MAGNRVWDIWHSASLEVTVNPTADLGADTGPAVEILADEGDGYVALTLNLRAVRELRLALTRAERELKSLEAHDARNSAIVMP